MNRRRRKKSGKWLVAAVMCEEAARVRALLRGGADPGAADGDGMTALYAAAVNGHTELVRLLLEAGAAPDAESAGAGSEGTPLCAAACWGHVGTVRLLLAHGADPGLREEDGTGWAPLDWALHGGHEETVRVLVEAGVTAPPAMPVPAPGPPSSSTPPPP
ncbi:ankyrin repeat domain-containing protein [Streptomyces huiliensis]|uniref:ankyrin repeat domain-containing protein n=1 Tax=Streptomyces huiliensis TaxID=2876027 RepID=UPI001CBD76FB|nr:ankyrin repeat domain-containing protein [Streptomyces huiliensis]MBZ4322124.1 ankyrin repeat domain-containing protein [Streptomyces huiliensis]